MELTENSLKKSKKLNMNKSFFFLFLFMIQKKDNDTKGMKTVIPFTETQRYTFMD